MLIKKINAKQILDMTGKPTVECSVNGFTASVPSGTSAGSHEAKAIDAKKAVENIDKIIAKKIDGNDFSSQEELDKALIKLDGTKDKSRLGANAILAVSMAFCKAHATDRKMQLYEYLSKLMKTKPKTPVPQFNLMNGGRHAGLQNDIQEHMIMPVGAKSFREAMQMGKDVYSELRKHLEKKRIPIRLGLEHGFVVKQSVDERLEMLLYAIDENGYEKEVKLALDCAASEFHKNGVYAIGSRKFDAGGLIDRYRELASRYPIVSVEDGLDENDFDGWAKMTKRLGIQVVGDDLLTTNVERIKRAALHKSCNAMILKPNQVGTVTEAIEAAMLAKKSNWNVVVSHRSRETKDTFMADLAVAVGSQCKFALKHDETKLNRLLGIEKNKQVRVCEATRQNI